MRDRAREIVAISPDGKVAARFHSIMETARRMRVSKSTICNRCNEMEKLKGYRLMYAEDWSPWGDYRHSGGERRRKRYKRAPFVLSEKGRKKKSDDAKINKPWLHRKVRRILCADTGVIFPSRREAAEWLSVDPRRLSSYISEHRRIKGYTMVYAP